MSGFDARYEVVCTADHKPTGGAAPGFVVSLHDTEFEAEKWILDMKEGGTYLRCNLTVRACES